MLKSRNTPLASYRRRLKRRGFTRLEVQIHKRDAALVRRIARALTDPEREAETRALLRQRFGERELKSLKALLAAAPLEGIDLERSGDTGRAVDL